MFEKLFGKVSDVVHHTIAPYAVERQRFLERCCEQGFEEVPQADRGNSLDRRRWGAT